MSKPFKDCYGIIITLTALVFPSSIAFIFLLLYAAQYIIKRSN